MYSKLGELQTEYQTFALAFIEFENYSGNGVYLHKKRLLHLDILRMESAKVNLLKQKQFLINDLGLTTSTFEANAQLVKDKTISLQEYRELTSKLISKQISIPQIEVNIAAYEGQIMDKQKEIMDLENKISTQKMQFHQALSTMKSKLSIWKQNYLLTAPISGILHFAHIVQENQQIQAGTPIGYIFTGNARYFLYGALPQTDFGKISIGQNVRIKIPAYPWHEFGILEGSILAIATVPADSSGYMVQIGLSNGLKTTNNKEIPYRERLAANIEIVTKDQRLLQRLYYSVIGKQ